MQYWGQGFSPRGDKNRFVLPADFRQAVRNASEGERILCLDRHHRLPCLVGFGYLRARSFADEVLRDEEKALRLGQDFDREERFAQLGGFHRANFDESGRFVLPTYLAEQVGVAAGLYFHGGGDYFTIWPPESLYAMGAGWDSVKASCRAQIAEAAAARGRRR